MADLCIPANPDISGIGVRTAIYVQNFLCFAPIVAHLWDGKVTIDELNGIKDQSISMLPIAFAILISTIIEAKGPGQGQSVTNFHAAVVLDLSWMNNTSTFIWFLLYAHHRSINDMESRVIPATWSGWLGLLFSPLRRLVMGNDGTSVEQDEKSHDHTDAQRVSNTHPPFLQRLRDVIFQAPVLTLGSIHLSLMASIGIWLWSDPSKFGAHISCDPTLTIVGGVAPFSSRALRIYSLLMYSLLLIPGVNLVPGFLFFISLHILYNKSRRRHTQFWTLCQRALNGSKRALRAVRNAPRTLRRSLNSVIQRQRVSPPYEEYQIGDNDTTTPSTARPSQPPPRTPSPPQPISPHPSVQDGNSHKPTLSQPRSLHKSQNFSSTPQSPSQYDTHVGFLVVGLVLLFCINGIFLSDIELTLSRNKQIQSREQDLWGFGQVFALLFLVITLRNFATSIDDIRKKFRERDECKDEIKREAQRQFEDSLRSAIEKNTLENYG